MLYQWLSILPLITLASAFYPYHDQDKPGHKRARLVAEEETIQSSDTGTVTLDLHRVQVNTHTSVCSETLLMIE